MANNGIQTFKTFGYRADGTVVGIMQDGTEIEILAGTPSFDPMSVGTPKVYYDMRVGVTQGAGIITAIVDQSGNGNDAVISGTHEPGYTATNAAYNNLPTCDFPVADTKRVAVPDLGLTTGAFTLVLVSDCQNTNGRYFTSNDGGVMVRRTAAAVNTFGTSGAGGLSGGTAANPNVIVNVFNGASGKLYVSAKTAVATGNNGAQDLTGQTLLLGNYAPSIISLFDQEGSTAFFAVYSGALSQADVEYLLDGFGALAGITIGA